MVNGNMVSVTLAIYYRCLIKAVKPKANDINYRYVSDIIKSNI